MAISSGLNRSLGKGRCPTTCPPQLPALFRTSVSYDKLLSTHLIGICSFIGRNNSTTAIPPPVEEWLAQSRTPTMVFSPTPA